MTLYIIKNGELRYIDDDRKPHISHAIENGKTFIVSDSELYHWKYVKKVRKNGRWVYYYDQSDLDKARSDMIQNKQNKQMYDFASEVSTLGTNDNSGTKITYGTRALDGSYIEYGPAVLAGAKYVESKKEYQKLAASTLIERTAAKAFVAVANFVSSVASKISSLFKKKKGK